VARKLIVEIAADPAAYIRGLREAAKATTQADTAVRELDLNTTKLAQAQVAAAVKSTAALEREAKAYRQIASAAEKGSREQVAATRLATQTEQRLASSLTATEHRAAALRHETTTMTGAFRGFARGATDSSERLRGLGRSIAYASAGFVGAYGLERAFTSTINVAVRAQNVIAQTQHAVSVGGQSWQKYGATIEQTTTALSGLSGFSKLDLLQTFSNLVRRTNDVNRALQLNALAANVARGRNISLQAAQSLVLKASLGMISGLRRVGLAIDKNATSTQALALLQAKYGNSAAVYSRTAAGAQDRFRVAIENLQETIGTQLLPSVTKYLNKGADWLNQTQNQKRVARDLHDVLAVLKSIFEAVRTAMSVLNDITGSTTTTLKLLLGVFVGYKTLKLAESVAGIAASLKLVGTEAEASTGKVALLRGSLLKLVANPYTVAIVLTVVGAEIVAHKIKALQEQYLNAQSRVFAPGSQIEKQLVPVLEKKIEEMRKQGKSMRQILVDLRQYLGGNTDMANALITEAFDLYSGQDKKGLASRGVVKLSDQPGYFATMASPDRDVRRAAVQAQALDRLTVISMRLAKAQAVGSQRDVLAALRDLAQFYRDMISNQEKLLKTDVAHRKVHAQIITNLYGQLQSTTDQISQINQKAAADRAAKAKASATKEQRAYEAEVRTRLVNLKATVDAAKKGTAARRAAELALEAALRAEAHDTRLSAEKRAGYRAALVAEQNRVATEAVQAAKAVQAATTRAQRAYAASVRTRLLDLRAAGDAAKKGTDARKKADAVLLAALRAEAHDAKLTREQRARYRDAAAKELQKERTDAEAAAKAARARRDAVQFLALGLTATGQQRTDTLKQLREEFAAISKAISTGLLQADAATRAQLKKIAGVLKDRSVGDAVRQWIQNYLDPLKQGTANANLAWAQFHKVSAKGLADVLGLRLSDVQRRRLDEVVAAMGRNGTVPGVSSPAFASAGARGGGIVITGDVHIHGVQDPGRLEDAFHKRAKQRPHRRRGAQ
jgi:hypothetical protein